MLQLYIYCEIETICNCTRIYKKTSTSEEHEAITNIIESLPLHTKKNPCMIMMQCCLNHIHKYTLGDYKDTYTWTSSAFLSKSYVIIFLKTCYLYMHYCINSPKIIYPLFKDQLFGERNSPGINSWRFITGVCVWHAWYSYVSLQI